MSREWTGTPRWLINSTVLVVALMVVSSIVSAWKVVQPAERDLMAGMAGVPAVPAHAMSPTVSPTVSPLPFASGRHLDVYAWQLVDRLTGAEEGENEHSPSYTASVMKIWYAQDAIDRHVGGYDLESMVRDSNDRVANELFARLGGASTRRGVSRCGLTDAVVLDWSWSRNAMSAADMVKLAECVGPQVLQWMATIRGESDFGPRKLLGPVAAKNGWLLWEGTWYVNCVAMTDRWALAIVQQYPAMAAETEAEGFARGRAGCEKATAALLA